MDVVADYWLLTRAERRILRRFLRTKSQGIRLGTADRIEEAAETSEKRKQRDGYESNTTSNKDLADRLTLFYTPVFGFFMSMRVPSSLLSCYDAHLEEE